LDHAALDIRIAMTVSYNARPQAQLESPIVYPQMSLISQRQIRGVVGIATRTLVARALLANRSKKFQRAMRL
jgi:hypothetical protein